MSNHNNRPRLGMPGAPPPIVPPPITPPPAPMGGATAFTAEFAALIEQFPLPWCVGPYGDIWVAEDVEQVDPDVVGPSGVIDGKWRATGDKARLVMENPSAPGIAALMVYATNKLGKV